MNVKVIPAIGLFGVLALAGCGTSNGGGNGNSNTCQGTVTIASDLPVSGSDASDGVPTANGVKLAVDQANANGGIDGCQINYIAKDDASVALGKHDPQQGASNIRGLAGNQAVIGVVGPFNSNVALAELPIANAANLPMISPSNTNPGLTIAGADPTINTASLKPSNKTTYFRVCTTDIGQGQGLASAAYSQLNLRKAFVIDDQETYGAGLANHFITDFKNAGGTVVDHVSLPGTTTDFRDTLNKANSEGADMIFFGGTSSNGGGIVEAQLKSLGLKQTLMGGDGIVDGEFLTQAGSSVSDVYGTIAAPDPTRLSSAAKFVSDYKAAFNAAPGAYSANAYDAANIIIRAAKEAIDANGGKLPSDPAAFRESVRSNIASISYDGAIGHTTFDANGDTSNVLLTLETPSNGAWVYKSTIQLKSGS